MIRLGNDNLGRMLHASIYARLRNFCVQHTPEFPPELVVNAWLQRLYNSDPTFHLLVTLDDSYKIIQHAVIDIQDAFGKVFIQCHQAQTDKPNVAQTDEIMEYLEKLKADTQAACIVFMTTRPTKAFEKKWGYKIFRTVLIKTNSEAEHG